MKVSADVWLQNATNRERATVPCGGIGCPLVWLYAPFVLEVVQQLHVFLGAANVGMELHGPVNGEIKMEENAEEIL